MPFCWRKKQATMGHFRKVVTMKQPRSFAQREDAGKKKGTKGGAISRRIERSEIDGSKSSRIGVAGRRHPMEREENVGGARGGSGGS